jgi:hypothetical protein
MANPDIVYVYPRGYLSYYTNSAPPENNELMKTTDNVLVQYIDGIYELDTIFGNKEQTVVLMILECIKLSSLLFGNDFNKWLALQLTSPAISVDSLTFIEDTVRFIKTGKRIVPVESAYRTAIDVERSRYNTELQKYVEDLSFKDPNTVSILCDWIAQPNGLRDIRCTLEILFGGERVVDRNIRVQPKPGTMHF